MKYQDLFAGLTTFTISNNKNDHYTFKVTHKNNVFFVNLLTGPDNVNSFTYIGLLHNNKLKLTNASKFNVKSIPVKVFNFAINILQGIKKLPNGYSILPSGTCFRCGRKLTTPESIKTGYGPVCIGLL